MGKKHVPSEHFFIQRTYPDTVFALKAYENALHAARQEMLQKKNNRGSSGLPWELEGPTNLGGRINTIAVDPTNSSVIYVGNASGGVFKTTNGGGTWTPIFDDQPFLAIGDIEIDPNHPDTVYVGTGDVNISGYPFIGDGIYKSTDGGVTWNNIGLAETRITSRIHVHPTNSNIIYAGTMGLPFVRNNDRGLYKSTDGGNTWTQVLFTSTGSGIIDFIVDPADPDRILAASWDRVRNNHESIISGPHGIIHRSTDGGQNWTDVSSSLLPDTISRIGLSLEPGGVVVAMALDKDQNTLYMSSSTDLGLNWSYINSDDIDYVMGGFGWYFGQVRINPYNPNDIYVLGVDLWRTSNNGAFWEMVGPPWYTYDVHADKHDLVFLNATTMYLATDGGLYRTLDNGLNWADVENIPNTQLYHVKVNPHKTRDYWAGAQDNGTTNGNANDLHGWNRVFGGDGFNPVFHPEDSNIFYCETQNGGIVASLDGGQNFISASQGLGFSSVERRNWDMPYIISKHDANVMYAGTYRVHKSTSSTNVYYNPISPDLTDGLILHPRYHNITTLRESPVTPNILLAGTVDANVWRTTDGGATWDSIHTGLPEQYVTDVEASYLDPQRIFVSHSGYKENDFIPHIHMSNDLGDSWIDISGNLPQLAINDLEVSAMNDSLIFVGTDGGVYFTTNLGNDWQRLGNNMPIVAIYDVEIDYELKRLVAGTFARSVQSISIDSFLLPQSAVIAIVSEDAEICDGESIQLFASGGSNYNWSPTNGLSCTDCAGPIATPSVTTTYTVTVSNSSGASDSATITITVNPTPPQPEIVLIEDTLTVNPAGEYIWILDGIPVSNMPTAFYIPDTKGFYEAETTTTKGCKNVSQKFAYFPTGFHAPEKVRYNLLFPNPASEVIYVKGNEGAEIGEIEVYDLAGQLILTSINYDQTEGLDVRKLPSGAYLLKSGGSFSKFIKR